LCSPERRDIVRSRDPSADFVIPPVRPDRTEPGVAVVSFPGDHDIASAPLLRERISTALAHRRPVVVDLSDALFVDSMLLGVLVTSLRRARRQGSAFALVLGDDPRCPAARALDVTGTRSMFPSYPSVSAALDALTDARLPA
jgi:anti-anti-sigma factor